MAQCRALKVDGTPCREEALPGSQFCYRSSHQAQYQSIGKKVVQFLRKHWFGILSFVVGLTGVIALIFYFQDKAREAMTGVLTSSGEASIQHVAIGTIRFRIHNPNGVLFQDGSDPL